MTSFLCRVVGHKWFLKSREVRPKIRSNDPHEILIIDTTRSPMSHRMRCGEPNPSRPLAPAVEEGMTLEMLRDVLEPKEGEKA